MFITKRALSRRTVLQGMGAAVADYDNDGYPDLYVTSYGRNILYRNQPQMERRFRYAPRRH